MQRTRTPFPFQAYLLFLFVAVSVYGCTQEFVPVPHGAFQMGSPVDEPGRQSDESLHPVTLSHDLEIMAKEASQQKFRGLMDYDPSFFSAAGPGSYFPVEQVSWFDALVYANRKSAAKGYEECYVLSDIECADGTLSDATNACKDNGGIADAQVELNGVTSVYDCTGYRLPTEAEWEYAARAGTATAFYNGPITYTACSPVDPNLDAIGWYCGNGEKRTKAGGKKAPNAWEIFDMIGNVAEWCWDTYESEYPESATDPEGPAAGYFRVVRGGSMRFDGASRCRCAHRAGHAPGFRDRYLGFRLVRTVSQGDTVDNQPAASWSNRTGVPETSGRGEPFGGSSIRKADGRASSYPDSLPFEFTRPEAGDPLTPEEITAFTRKITSFWNQVSYFHWVLWHSHGMDASNPEGMPDYKLYWQDTQAIKNGDGITFEHRGGADNIMIRTSKVLSNAMAGYLASGDPTLGRVVEQYCKGFVAQFRGMMWDENDPEKYLMPRAIFTQENAYTEDGRDAFVDYEPVRHAWLSWNAHTINNPNNPYWGNIWIRNMRSKDDVPHMFRTIPLMMRTAEEGQDPEVRQAVALALEYMQGFARDIVDTGYYIRTKDKYGNAYIPRNDNEMIKDLASFVEYDKLVPNAECDAKLASALIGYGSPLDIDCENGIGWLYEAVASYGHYFNLAIIRNFHAAAITNALMVGEDGVALELLEGMAKRIDAMMAGKGNWEDYSEWDSDTASFLLVAGTTGMPLTAEEARFVQEQYSLAVDFYETWPNWDPWDPSVPDGEIEYKPDRNGELDGEPVTVVRPTELTYLLEYCYSPFRNETGADLVDCDIILDPARWGD